jgi:hypothetical protein
MILWQLEEAANDLPELWRLLRNVVGGKMFVVEKGKGKIPFCGPADTRELKITDNGFLLDFGKKACGMGSSGRRNGRIKGVAVEMKNKVWTLSLIRADGNENILRKLGLPIRLKKNLGH